MKTVYDFIKRCGVYYLATIDGDQPRVRPFGTIDIFEDKLYIQTGKVKDVARQIDENPKVELSCFDGSTWLRLEGTLVEDDRVEAQAHMLDGYPDLKVQYEPGDGNTVVYYFKDATATFTSFGSEPIIVRF